MQKESIGAILKRLRMARGYSQRKLGTLSGINASHISQLESGKRFGISLRTATALANALEVSPHIFLEGDVGELPPISPRPMQAILKEVQARYEALGIVEVPVKGVVPAGHLSLEENHIEDYFPMPRGLLGTISESVFALRVTGDSLVGDAIQSGDLVVVDADAELMDGRIYILRVGDELQARHLYRESGKLRLVTSTGEQEVMEEAEVEIKGRVVLAVFSGTWRRH